MFLRQLFSNTLGTAHNRMEREKTLHALILPTHDYQITRTSFEYNKKGFWLYL